LHDTLKIYTSEKLRQYCQAAQYFFFNYGSLWWNFYLYDFACFSNDIIVVFVVVGGLPMAKVPYEIGPLREFPGPGVVRIDASFSSSLVSFRWVPTCPLCVFLYLFLKLFTEEAIFIEDGILFHSSTTLCEKKRLTSSCVAAWCLKFSGPSALLVGRLAWSQTMTYCSLCQLIPEKWKVGIRSPVT